MQMLKGKSETVGVAEVFAIPDVSDGKTKWEMPEEFNKLERYLWEGK